MKLNNANSMLPKIRNYVDIKKLKSIYHAIFGSHLSYASLVWVQNSSIQHHGTLTFNNNAIERCDY